jgi:hypothetical protein
MRAGCVRTENENLVAMANYWTRARSPVESHLRLMADVL